MGNKDPEEQLTSRVQKYHKNPRPRPSSDDSGIPQEAPAKTLAADPPPRESEKLKKPVKEKPVKKPNAARGWVITILLAIVVSLLLRIFVFEIVLVDGDSMLPTLNSSQRVVVEKVSRYFGLPQKGGIVITRYPNMPGYYVKRLIGYPGDTVEIKDSVVYVNGSALKEDYLEPGQAYGDMPLLTVPAGAVFVMGDNRVKSLDSRADAIGPVPVEYLLGDGLMVIWPFGQIHMLDS